MFRRNHERFVPRPKTRPHDERAIAADSRVDEITCEALGLRLSADKNGDAEHNAAKAQKQCALAMRQKTQRNIKRRRHGAFGGGGELTIRCRTASPARNLSWSDTIT